MKFVFFKKHFAFILMLAIVVLAAPLLGQQVINVRTGQTYTTIQSAINAASGGDTLLVSPATYRENITVNKSLRIKGENRTNTIIIGNTTGDVFQITASYVTLKNFTIKFNYDYPNIYPSSYAGIRITSTSKSNTINCNNIQDCYKGFLLDGGVNTGNVISNNNIANDVTGQSIDPYYNFWIQNSSGNKIYGNKISSALNQHGTGIFLYKSSNNEISANDIYGNYYGIYLLNTSNYNIIHHNNFDNVQYNAYTENSLGSCIGNKWYLVSTSVGNYWSDHTGPDANNDGIIDIPYDIPGGTDQDLYPLVARYPVCNAEDLIVRTTGMDLLLFPFENGIFTGTGTLVGNGWNFTHYFVGHWNTDYPTHDLLARKSNGEIWWFPYRDETFYTDGIHMVGQNFYYTDYFVGNWTDNATDDLLVRDSAGNMWLYPFINEAFDSPIFMGSGWNYTHYFVGNWSGDNYSDLICRDSSGYMWYYRFVNGAFAARIQVGNGWNFTHYFVGNWTNDGTDDLIVRDSNGNMKLYPFRNGSFYSVPGAGTIVATGWNFTDYFVGDWNVNVTDAMVVRDSNGNLKLYSLENGTSGTTFGTGSTVGTAFNYTHYFVGQWTND